MSDKDPVVSQPIADETNQPGGRRSDTAKQKQAEREAREAQKAAEDDEPQVEHH